MSGHDVVRTAAEIVFVGVGLAAIVMLIIFTVSIIPKGC